MTSATTSTSAVRWPASDFPSITGLTLLPPDAHASLVNISATGLLSESTARLQVSATVIVQFHGTFSPSSVVARVVRCEVTAMGKDGLLRYGIAVEFASPIGLGGDGGERVPRSNLQTVRNRW